MSAAPEVRSCDVLIIGGGVVGSAIAYFLAADPDFDGVIAVVEKDPTYADGSTARSVGGIRQQFSTPENIAMSQFSAEFFRDAEKLLAVDDSGVDLSFEEAGYLYLASLKGMRVLHQNHALQRSHQADVLLLDREGLEERFPWLRVDDLAGGSLGLSGEGWIDAYSLLTAFRRKAEALGVVYIHGTVTSLIRERRKILAARLSSRHQIACGEIVDAAGPAAAKIAEMAGIELPVHSRKRFVYTFETDAEVPDCPLVIDPSGVYFRPESGRFLCGTSPSSENDPDCDDFKIDTRLFDEVIWPALAHRVPAFDRLERRKTWAGHYAVNVIDRNAILGPHPEVKNFHLANGFSGHGLQQAPAVGRAITEMIVHRRYKTLDLRRFGFERFGKQALIQERNVI